MRIKILTNTTGHENLNREFEALVNKAGNQAVYFDDSDLGWFANQGEFKIVEDKQVAKAIVSIRDLLGQDLGSINFK